MDFPPYVLNLGAPKMTVISIPPSQIRVRKWP